MNTMHIVSIGVDSDELVALRRLIDLVKMTPESQELLLKATPLLSNLNATYDEVASNTQNDTRSKKSKKKDEIELLKATIDRQRWQISGLMVQAMLSKQMTFFAGQNNTAVMAAHLTNPDKVKLRCVYHGDFEVRPRNIIAIESNGKLKKLFLKEPIRSTKSSTKRLSFEVKSGFDTLIPMLQKQIQLFFRIHDSYAVNLFEYKLLRQGIFVMKDDDLTAGDYDVIRRIKVDSKFNAKNYQKLLEEIEIYEGYMAKFEPSKEQIKQLDKQMGYFNDKYGNKPSSG